MLSDGPKDVPSIQGNENGGEAPKECSQKGTERKSDAKAERIDEKGSQQDEK